MSHDTNNSTQRRRYALITGASSGIGEAMAIYAAGQGFHVGLTARRAKRLNNLAQQIRHQYSVEVDVFPMDLSLNDSAQTLIAEVSRAGRHIDILVNNAGMTIPVMALSSGGKGHTLYPGGKAFLLKFSQSLNAEFKGQNINVSAILPGVVSTNFQRANGAKEIESHRFSQTAEQVARIAWTKNDRGQEIIVPGFSAKIAAVLFGYIPERIIRFITRPVAEKYYIDD